MTQEEKQRIDYEIQSKIKARNEEVDQWAKAGLLAIISFIAILIIVTIITK